MFLTENKNRKGMLLTGLARFKIYRIFPVISVHCFANNLVSRVLSLSGSNAMTRGSLKQLWTMFFKVKGNCNFTSFVIILCYDDCSSLNTV